MGGDFCVGFPHQPCIERFAVDQFRRVLDVEIIGFDRFPFRNRRFGGGPPAASELVFEERVDGVERAPLPMPRKDDAFAGLL